VLFGVLSTRKPTVVVAQAHTTHRREHGAPIAHSFARTFIRAALRKACVDFARATSIASRSTVHEGGSVGIDLI